MLNLLRYNKDYCIIYPIVKVALGDQTVHDEKGRVYVR